MSTALDVFVDGRQRDSLHRTALGKGLPTQRLVLLLAGTQRHTHAGHDTTVIPLSGRPELSRLRVAPCNSSSSPNHLPFWRRQHLLTRPGASSTNWPPV